MRPDAFVEVSRTDVSSLIDILRATDGLVGPAEMFRCLDYLSKGIFPREVARRKTGR